MIIEEGDKRRCERCKRRVPKDEIVGKSCLICGDSFNENKECEAI